MPISDGEKLILAMLSDVHKHLQIHGNIDPNFVMETIERGYLWGFKWKYSGLALDGDPEPPALRETCEILDMYRLLTRSFDHLSPTDQQQVRAGAAPSHDFIKFQGFDGNNDEHSGIVHYLTEQLEIYAEHKGQYLNSHSSSTLHKYRRMLAAYTPMIKPYPSAGLSATQLIQILKA
jgi:uncharacterized protein YfbU (UPF0304 family)